jgi:hypothetical protein
MDFENPKARHCNVDRSSLNFLLFSGCIVNLKGFGYHDLFVVSGYVNIRAVFEPSHLYLSDLRTCLFN